ncbi:MAG: GLUG motif-containing protein [Candidatus Omnitrophota bacterium]
MNTSTAAKKALSVFLSLTFIISQTAYPAVENTQANTTYEQSVPGFSVEKTLSVNSSLTSMIEAKNELLNAAPVASNPAAQQVSNSDSVQAVIIIRSVFELQNISNNLNARYVLANDIDASATKEWNGGLGFKSIANFSGIFDGQGYTISNLYINRPDEDFVGLFGSTVIGPWQTRIKDVQLESIAITGLNYVGGLVGHLYNGDNGAIERCSVTGTVKGLGNYVGGLVGSAYYGTISQSFTSATVSGYALVGGLVGNNGSDIYDSYSISDVNGKFWVGGLVGLNNAEWHYYYANVPDIRRVYYLAYAGDIYRSYAAGKVTGIEIGGLVGNAFEEGPDGSIGSTVSDSYWDINTSGATKSAGGTGKTTAQMMDASTFKGWDISYDAGHTWIMAGYPHLQWEWTDTITNASQLQMVTLNTSANYTIANDIDASATKRWNGGLGFKSIANFSGIFDGKNKVISNLYINRPDESNIGLFGSIKTIDKIIVGQFGDTVIDPWETRVMNVQLESVSITGYQYVGGLCGYNEGTISASSVTGNVSAYANFSFVGGLVGSNFGKIYNSWTDGKVTGQVAVGGLAGANDGTISKSWSKGIVKGYEYVGGLCGYGYYNSAILTSYATGNVIGASHAGGLIGMNNGRISSSHATGDVIGSGKSNYMGGLVGRNLENGKINNSWASGDLTNGIYYSAGGLVGANYGTISNSRAIGDVKGYADLGGLVGRNEGLISTSYARGNVTGSNYEIGGLVGINTVPGKIYGSWASGIIRGYSHVGGLVGENAGIISASHATGDAIGTTDSHRIGGLAGENQGSIYDSWAGGSVSGAQYVGGLVGQNYDYGVVQAPGVISASYATGVVKGLEYIGGLVGYNIGTISDAYATGNVRGVNDVGGLAGKNNGLISNSYAKGKVIGIGSDSSNIGGLAGANSGKISKSWATGAVNGYMDIGGLAGCNTGLIFASYALGNVTGTNYVAGLVGWNYDNGVSPDRTTISDSYATGYINGHDYVGGLVGWSNGLISASHATGSVTGTSYVGGLTAVNIGKIYNSWASGVVKGHDSTGGLVGLNDGLISASYAIGKVIGAYVIVVEPVTNLNVYSFYVGGLVGENHGKILNSWASGAVKGCNYVGGLVGLNDGLISSSHATVNVTSYYSDGSSGIGGLAGVNTGKVLNSWSKGAVSGFLNIGGLIGINSGVVLNSWAIGVVNGYIDVGGLVGFNTRLGKIYNSWAMGTIRGTGYVGGLVGWNLGLISKCRAMARVFGKYYVGRLVGYNGGTIID